MSKCIDCGSNFVGTPEQPPPEGLRCKSCEIKRLKSENARLAAEKRDLLAPTIAVIDKMPYCAKCSNVLYTLVERLRASFVGKET